MPSRVEFLKRVGKQSSIAALFLSLSMCFPSSTTAATNASWDELQKEGDAHQVDGQYAAASEKFKAALDLAANTKGNKSPEYLKSLARLCAALAIQGNYAQAEPYYKSLMTAEIAHPKNGAADPEVGVWYDDLADTYFARLEPGKREISLEHTLSLKEKIYGKDSRMLPRFQNELINWYLAHGEAKKALPLALKRLSILEKTAKNPDATFMGIFGLAVIEYKLGHYHESLNYLSQASSLPTTPLTTNLKELFIRQSRGYCYLKLGMFPRAIDEFTQLSQYAEKDITARARNLQGWEGLGEVAAAKGDLAGAEKYFRRELQEMPSIVGQDSPEQLIPINSLRTLLKREHKSGEIQKLDSLEKTIRAKNKDTTSKVFLLFN
jgi:tetratricopeptide (TPR) repeat protein